MSKTALSNAVKSNSPEESIFTRFLEGMTSHVLMLTETSEISQEELDYLKEKARLTSCSSYNKALTVFVRGENVEITDLSDNTNSIYHQLYNKAYETSEKSNRETPKFSIPNFAVNMLFLRLILALLEQLTIQRYFHHKIHSGMIR